jgi:hypothetical protein
LDVMGGGGGAEVAKFSLAGGGGEKTEGHGKSVAELCRVDTQHCKKDRLREKAIER